MCTHTVRALPLRELPPRRGGVKVEHVADERSPWWTRREGQAASSVPGPRPEQDKSGQYACGDIWKMHGVQAHRPVSPARRILWAWTANRRPRFIDLALSYGREPCPRHGGPNMCSLVSCRRQSEARMGGLYVVADRISIAKRLLDVRHAGRTATERRR